MSKKFFLQLLVDILPLGSGSMDLSLDFVVKRCSSSLSVITGYLPLLSVISSSF